MMVGGHVAVVDGEVQRYGAVATIAVGACEGVLFVRT